ncbi:MAG: c-type cytochrome [Acidobacteriota bacterium]|nr:c-type cytochrome [Acidobacteriota bacterium]
MVLFALPAFGQMQPDLGSEAQRASGRVLYDKYCAQCHGVTGDGRGPARAHLKPWPRDFTSGTFKFRTTPSGSMPTTEDIVRVIRMGVPYTSMPAFPDSRFSDEDVLRLVYYIKGFSDRFSDPDYLQPPIAIASPPELTEASITRGRELYGQIGCVKCHGDGGLGNGTSAPTLKDDWGQHIRPADMSARWTFRGGPTRQDIYRAFSTGFNGTPMPSYYDTLSEEDRWHLTNYIYSIGDGDEPGYATLVVAEPVEGDLDISEGAALFESARPARFPLVGQIMEPGRSFYTSTSSVVVSAIYNRKEIALMIRWHDMLADTQGTNDPTLVVPSFDETQQAETTTTGEADDSGDDFWGGEEAAGDDFWGEVGAEAGGDEQGPGVSEYSDAVAVQLPVQIPSRIRKPYFLLGDAENPVDLWFADLARAGISQLEGRGSAACVPSATDEFEVARSYDDGEWTVIVKRALKSSKNVTFREDVFVPIAFSVWDGFQEERGNKRNMTQWMYLYLRPREVQSAVGPMIKGALAALVVELVLFFWLRRRFKSEKAAKDTGGGALATQRAAGQAS